MKIDVTEVAYAIMVNGKEKMRFNERVLAEAALVTFSEDERATAAIVPITNDGKQILFG
jgi:hypothetical protein